MAVIKAGSYIKELIFKSYFLMKTLIMTAIALILGWAYIVNSKGQSPGIEVVPSPKELSSTIKKSINIDTKTVSRPPQSPPPKKPPQKKKIKNLKKHRQKNQRALKYIRENLSPLKNFFDPEELVPFIDEDNPPQGVALHTEDGPFIIETPVEYLRGTTLNLGTDGFVERVKNDRKTMSRIVRLEKTKEEGNLDHPPKAPSEHGGIYLSPDSYKVLNFTPGQNSRGGLIEPPKRFSFSLQGPDHYFTNIDSLDKESLAALRERTVSFGHGGSLTLGVEYQGFIKNEEGFDFVIYENPFRFGNNKIYMELAKVGVSQNGQEWLWFPCEPPHKVVTCAGVVPTDEGGDGFDLSVLGLESISYIKIVDTGKNHGKNMGANTEGFDLDSVSYVYPYRF